MPRKSDTQLKRKTNRRRRWAWERKERAIERRKRALEGLREPEGWM